MRIPIKLSLLVGASACLPLLLSGLSSAPRAADGVAANLDSLRAQEARELASSIQDDLLSELEKLEFAARALSGARPGEAERVLAQLERGLEGVVSVGLYDRAGTPALPPLGFALRLFERAPVARALERGSAIAPPLPDADEPRVVLAAVTQETPARLLLADVSLRSFAARVEAFRSKANGGARLIGPRFPEPPGGGTSAPVPVIGYRVAVYEPEGARAGLLQLVRGRAYLFGALGLFCALLAGLLAARRELAPVLRLRDAALQISSGARDVQVETRAPEELARLLSGFNEMSRSLQLREELGARLGDGGRRGLSELMQLSLTQLRSAVPFDRASALFSRSGHLELVAELGYASHDEARRLAPRNGAVAQALQQHTATLSEEGKLLALPLIERGQVLGAVALEAAAGFRLEQAPIAHSFLGPATRLLGSARLSDEVQLSRTHDLLTGLFNRRHFLSIARQLFDTAQRFTQPLAAVLVDVDGLRRINEAHGHAVGDEVLREVSLRCKSALRDVDLIGRYGGEELAILLPMTPRTAAVEVLPLLQATVAARPVVTSAGPLQVTISAGAASTAQGTRNLGELLRFAETALLESRQLTRAGAATAAR